MEVRSRHACVENCPTYRYVLRILVALYAMRFWLAAVIQGFLPMQAYGGEYGMASRSLLLAAEINSSVNNIIYYRMGSKFRRTFKLFFLAKALEGI
ncbi:hypothetical protein ElyMa_002449500 [Elysia marginata]|uniref:G-protein coupled receptors family 1 profile domain-containing protein n=1 Tax=Elysia marginata TaxID=1093978 RepID=A0AAV4GL76_9GAST|nr:hypothetical protein ElyMa_002449500 [Elysia marginata]